MKRILIYIGLFAGIAFTSCNDSYLEKTPVTDLTEENAFNSYDNFKNFMWPCYEIFINNTSSANIPIGASFNPSGWGQSGQYQSDMDAGYLESKYVSSFNKYAYQTISNVNSGNGWNFGGVLRRANIMLSHVDESSMTDAEKNHWKAVAYFFHSYWYMELISRFGDVPWVDKPLNESSPEIYEGKMPRKEVADKVLERLQWAEQNIGDFSSKDGDNTINKDCILAAISRFTLREGTWRKYHNLGDYEKYLTECVRTSEILMNNYPTLYLGTDEQPAAGYGEMWTTDDLSKVLGIIFYKSHVPDINPTGACHVEHTSSHYVEMNQNTVDLYLMKNGKPITNANSEFQGNETMYKTFRNRDPRLYHSVIPPYKVKAGKGNYPSWSYTDDPADREYIDIMGANTSCSNPGVGMKRIPSQNWSASLVPEIPRIATGSFVSCRSGYYFYKLSCNWEQNFNNGNLNVADQPIFKVEEMLLNYAEAKFELGGFDQTEADKSINKLRARAGVASMVVSEIDANFDPNRGKYYPEGNTTGILVDPVLWEIRRERIIELMGEGFGFYDIRRWRMAPWFLNKAPKGIWMSKADAKKNNMTLYNESTGVSDGVDGSMTEGHLFLFNDPMVEGKGWLEKYYLYQIPTDEILLNPNITQNPGWQ